MRITLLALASGVTLIPAAMARPFPTHGGDDTVYRTRTANNMPGPTMTSTIASPATSTGPGRDIQDEAARISAYILYQKFRHTVEKVSDVVLAGLFSDAEKNNNGNSNGKDTTASSHAILPRAASPTKRLSNEELITESILALEESLNGINSALSTASSHRILPRYTSPTERPITEELITESILAHGDSLNSINSPATTTSRHPLFPRTASPTERLSNEELITKGILALEESLARIASAITTNDPNLINIIPDDPAASAPALCDSNEPSFLCALKQSLGAALGTGASTPSLIAQGFESLQHLNDEAVAALLRADSTFAPDEARVFFAAVRNVEELLRDGYEQATTRELRVVAEKVVADVEGHWRRRLVVGNDDKKTSSGTSTTTTTATATDRSTVVLPSTFRIIGPANDPAHVTIEIPEDEDVDAESFEDGKVGFVFKLRGKDGEADTEIGRVVLG